MNDLALATIFTLLFCVLQAIGIIDWPLWVLPIVNYLQITFWLVVGAISLVVGRDISKDWMKSIKRR